VPQRPAHDRPPMPDQAVGSVYIVDRVSDLAGAHPVNQFNSAEVVRKITIVYKNHFQNPQSDLLRRSNIRFSASDQAT